MSEEDCVGGAIGPGGGGIMDEGGIYYWKLNVVVKVGMESIERVKICSERCGVVCSLGRSEVKNKTGASSPVQFLSLLLHLQRTKVKRKDANNNNVF